MKETEIFLYSQIKQERILSKHKGSKPTIDSSPEHRARLQKQTNINHIWLLQTIINESRWWYEDKMTQRKISQKTFQNQTSKSTDRCERNWSQSSKTASKTLQHYNHEQSHATVQLDVNHNMLNRSNTLASISSQWNQKDAKIPEIQLCKRVETWNKKITTT